MAREKKSVGLRILAVISVLVAVCSGLFVMVAGLSFISGAAFALALVGFWGPAVASGESFLEMLVEGLAMIVEGVLTIVEGVVNAISSIIP